MRFEFFKRIGEGWVKTFGTGFAENNMFPASGPIRIPLQILCNSDLEAHIRVSAFTEDNVECNRATF